MSSSKLFVLGEGNLLYFEECQLVRGRASKNCDRNLERRFVFVDLFDLAGKARERTRFDSDDLAGFVGKLRFRLLGRDLDIVIDLVNLSLRKRRPTFLRAAGLQIRLQYRLRNGARPDPALCQA